MINLRYYVGKYIFIASSIEKRGVEERVGETVR